jgi:hypothetical protein
MDRDGLPGLDPGAPPIVTGVAAVIRTLALALWVGGTSMLDFVEAPLRFSTGIIDRNQAVGLGQVVIIRWVRAEWALGVIVLVSSLVAASPAWSVWLVVLMLAVVTVQGVYLAPAITLLARGLDFVQRASHDPRYASIRQLHTAYAVLELIVLVAGAVVLAASVRPAKR